MASGLDHVRRIKGALLIIGILILGCILFLFILRKHEVLPDQKTLSTEEKNATMSATGIHHATVTENETIIFILDARSLTYHIDESSVFLSDLTATFFSQQTGETSILSAKSGTWRTDSNDLEVNGDVVLKNEQYEMLTESLIYINDDRKFRNHSPVVVRMVGRDSEIQLNRITYDLDSGDIDFSDIDGEFELNGMEDEFSNDNR